MIATKNKTFKVKYSDGITIEVVADNPMKALAAASLERARLNMGSCKVITTKLKKEEK